MSTHFKSISVFLDNSEASARLAEYAAGLAQRHKAHLIGVYGITSAEAEHPEYAFARGAVAIGDAIAHLKTMNEEKVLAAGRHFEAQSRAYDISSEFRTIWIDHDRDDVLLHSLHCDLVILSHPKISGIPEGWTPDRLLRATGVPVLLVPSETTPKTGGDHVLVAWNASREARRAINDAMSFIEMAKIVTVLVIDPDNGAHPYGQEPGADLAKLLARHGARVEVDRVASHGTPVGEVILAHATKCGADMIISGASSHSLVSGIIFGGITRTLISQLSVPLFTSR